jgi:hopanoid biosynthesis associated protein HpnK
MKRLIVNADDFGLTDGVNRAVLEAHQNGIVSSATLLANGSAFDSAVELSRTVPLLGVGIHLNLSEGRPVANAPRGSSLLNPQGMLYLSPSGLAWRLLVGKISPRDIETELRAQVEKVLSAGIMATHLDGHKHVHMLRPVFRIVLRLAREYGIRGVRCSVESLTGLTGILRHRPLDLGTVLKQYLGGRVLRVYSQGFRRLVKDAGLCQPEFFVGLTQTGFLDSCILGEILCRLAEGVTELMCHPGYLDGDLRGLPTRLLAQREQELEALTDPRMRDLIASQGIELINYRELAGST